MIKSLLKEGGLYIVANLLTKGVSLLLIPFYTSYFTTSEYGILSILGVFGSIIGAVVTFQIYQGVARYIAEDGVTDAVIKKLISTGFWFTFSTFSLFTIIAFVFKDQFIGFLSADVVIPESTYLLSIIVVSINALFYNLSIQLRFLRRVNEFTIISFVHSIFNILLIIFFAIKFDLGLNSIYYASLVVTPLIIIYQIIILKKYLAFYLGYEELKKMLKFSIPLVFSGISYIVLNSTDRIFIKEMLSMSKNGIYEVAFKFSSIIGIVIFGFQAALSPVLYKDFEKNETKIEMSNIFNLFFFFGTTGVIILSIFSYETLYFFTQPKYYEAIQILPVFYLTILITGLALFSPGPHLKGKTKIMSKIVIIAAVINITLNYFLIKQLGLIGASIGTLISVVVNQSSLFFFSQKIYYIKYDTKKIKYGILLFILTYCYILVFCTNNEITIKTIFIKIILVFLYIILLFKIKIIEYSKLKTFLKK